jgi:hypothetical protein
MPETLWELMVTVVNRLIIGNASVTSAAMRRTFTTAKEMRKWYAVLMALENTWGNRSGSLRNHLKSIKEDLCDVWPHGMGQSRWLFLRSKFQPSVAEIRQFCQLIAEASKSCLVSIHSMAFDEQLAGYHPRSSTKKAAEAAGSPIPVCYIPRKPDPNGLLTYLVSNLDGSENLKLIYSSWRPLLPPMAPNHGCLSSWTSNPTWRWGIPTPNLL